MIQALSQARVKVSIAMMVIALILCFLTAWYGKTHQVLFPPSPAPPMFLSLSSFPFLYFHSFFAKFSPVIFSYFPVFLLLFYPISFLKTCLFCYLIFYFLFLLLFSFMFYSSSFHFFFFSSYQLLVFPSFTFLLLFLLRALSFSILSIPFTFPLTSSQFFHPFHFFYFSHICFQFFRPFNLFLFSSYQLSVFP